MNTLPDVLLDSNIVSKSLLTLQIKFEDSIKTKEKYKDLSIYEPV